MAGDKVKISVPNDGFCAIEEILPRKNKLRRPALANLDILVLVCSTVEPLPNFTVIDKMTAAAVNNNMEPVIVVTKIDLENGDRIADIYRHAGFRVFLCSDDSSSQTEELKSYLHGKVSAFIGNSGVGKSTLLNRLFPSLSLETGQTSKKLGRGRHTTRVVELFELDGCFVADTPGFSTVDLQRYEMIDKTQLQYCFPEFENTSVSVCLLHVPTPAKRVAEYLKHFLTAKLKKPVTAVTPRCTTRLKISNYGR